MAAGHQADRPVDQLIHRVRQVDGCHSWRTPGHARPQASALGHSESAVGRHHGCVTLAAHGVRSGCGVPAHVRCHARRSLRLRICPSRRRVKGLSVSDARPAGGVTRGDVGSDAPVDLEDPLLEAREGPALDGEEQNEPSSKTADGREWRKKHTPASASEASCRVAISRRAKRRAALIAWEAESL